MKKLIFLNGTELNVNESDFDLLLDFYEKTGDIYALKSGMSGFEVSDSEWVDESFLTAVGFNKTDFGFEMDMRAFKIQVNKEFSKMTWITKVKCSSVPSRAKINEWVSRLLFEPYELGFTFSEYDNKTSYYRKPVGGFTLSYTTEKRAILLTKGPTVLYDRTLEDLNQYLSVRNDLWELTKEG